MPPPPEASPRAAADLAGPDDAADADAAAPTPAPVTISSSFAPLPEKFNVWDFVGKCIQPVLRAGVACGPPLKLGAAHPAPPRLPVPRPPLPETPRAALDAELARLAAASRAWRAVPPPQRAALMGACLRTFLAQMDAMARATAEIRGTGDGGLGEDYSALVPVVMALADLRASLRAGGRPRPLALWRRRLSAREVEAGARAAAAAAGGGAAAAAAAEEQWVAKVFPEGMAAIMYPGFSGEVWIMPGAAPTQGRIYREKEQEQERRQAPGIGGGAGAPATTTTAAATTAAAPPSGAAASPPPPPPPHRREGAALVLGAGNQLAVACMDALHKLCADDEAVLLKFNPVNERAGPLVERALAPLAPFLGYAYGGAGVGAYLAGHPLVSSIHLTGSARTYNAIAWGDPDGPPPSGGAAEPRPPPGSPLARGVFVGAELGNVTPYVIVPGGEWTEADLRRHADGVVSGVVNNCGHNCLAAEVIVTDARWPLRAAFLAAVRERLARSWRRAPYYPGSAGKLAAFRRAFPDAEALGRPPPAASAAAAAAAGGGEASASAGAAAACPAPEPVPWLLKTGLTADQARVSDENWCGVVQEVALTYGGGGGDAEAAATTGRTPSSPPPPPDVPAFLRAATDFCNDRCWGTLAASVFVHPQVEAQHAREVDAAVGCLRYGSVSVNAPTLGAFAVASLGWGAFAAAGTPTDIGTGNCVVHNTFLFDAPQKSVFRAPWRTAPAQLWSASQANLEGAVPAAARFLDAAGDGRPAGAMASVTLAAVRAVRGTVGRTC